MTTTSGASSWASAMPVGDRAGLAGDVEPVGLGERAGEPLADQLVVVDQQDGGHGLPGCRLPASSGRLAVGSRVGEPTRTVTRVPGRSGVGSSTTQLGTDAARSARA